MAKGKTTINTGSTAAPKKAESKPRKKSSKPQAPPEAPGRGREITAVIFSLLAIFIIISLFNTDGMVIAFIADLFKGLIGWGYWLTAPVLILSALLLFTQKNKPVSMRVTAAILSPVVFAALVHLFMCDSMNGSFEFNRAVTLFFEDGKLLQSGGVLGGLLAVGLDMAFSVFGAAPMLILLLAVFLIYSVRGGFSGLFAHREKKPAEAAPETKAVPSVPPLELTEKPAKHAKKSRKSEKDDFMPQIEEISRSAAFADIPLGEDDESLDFDNLDYHNFKPVPIDEKPQEPRGLFKAKAKKKKVSVKAEEKLLPISGREKDVFDIPDLEDDEEDGFKEFPMRNDALRPVTLSTEISDPPKKKKSRKEELAAEARAVQDEISLAPAAGGYEFPPVSLLNTCPAVPVDTREEIMTNRSRLEGALRSFGINAGIVGVTCGPTVTRYDVELEQGVKLSKITNLAGDLALALGVVNVRIAPIPDKISTVGIEVPNRNVSTVYLRDVIDSEKFKNAKSKLSFALGKDISGDCIVGNIAKLPHMLIAGTTGSGKSVCMNCLILSLLYKARPEEVRLIMIDPKMVELGIYNGIPHLFVPVVTDPKKAAGALQWSVVEMLKRYRLFSEVGVRNLAGYNKYCTEHGEETLPQIVIVIDELADLMMAASKEVEESICRVAQMGRAAGMHLIIATQRPSADVITGLMKANIPSRIAFAVSSSMESRIILDQGGAEKLIGMGDMLFAPVGCRKPIRIQGAFVSDEEREEVIDFIKQRTESTDKNNEIEEFMNKAAEDKSAESSKASSEEDFSSEYDEMLPHAVEVILETGSCSVSMLQRRVKLGYSRAARIVDQMEELGIVGPYEGAKPRQVLVDRAGWQDIQAQLGLVRDDDMSLAAEMSRDSDINF